MSIELKVDPARLEHDDTTGVYVRAQKPDGTWASVDIATLDKQSLLTWLNESVERATRVILHLFNHY